MKDVLEGMAGVLKMSSADLTVETEGEFNSVIHPCVCLQRHILSAVSAEQEPRTEEVARQSKNTHSTRTVTRYSFIARSKA